MGQPIKIRSQERLERNVSENELFLTLHFLKYSKPMISHTKKKRPSQELSKNAAEHESICENNLAGAS